MTLPVDMGKYTVTVLGLCKSKTFRMRVQNKTCQILFPGCTFCYITVCTSIFALVAFTRLKQMQSVLSDDDLQNIKMFHPPRCCTQFVSVSVCVEGDQI